MLVLLCNIIMYIYFIYIIFANLKYNLKLTFNSLSLSLSLSFFFGNAQIINIMPSGATTLVPYENYWTKCRWHYVDFTCKGKKILRLFTYILEISQKWWNRIKNYWDFYVLLKCIVITIFTDLLENAGCQSIKTEVKLANIFIGKQEKI